MSQHSLSIANEAGAAFRADVNSALQALASQSSGTSAPGTTYAYQRWADTTNGVVKRRNAANSLWVVDGPLAETYLVARSSNTILAVADHEKTFIATGTFTQTLTAAATLGDGWNCFYRNDGAGVITIDPNSTETIDGGLVLTLQPGEGCRIACNGTAFKTQGLAWKIVKRKTADESVTSSVTLQDDDHLTFPIGANEEWVADFYVGCGNLLTSTGIKSAVTVPAGATLDVTGWFATVTAGNDQTGNSQTSGTGWITFTPGAGNTGGIHVHVWVLNGATAGNVTLQWAQGTSNGNPLTFRKGAHMTAIRIA